MKCLPDLSLEAALEGAPFGPAHATPLSLELHLTELHRAHAGSHPALRELAFLRAQFPCMLQGIQEDDLFAGRIRYPLVSFSPEPGGFGYACNATGIRRVLESRNAGHALRDAAEEMLGYWSTRTTAARTRASLPGWVASTLPSDAWTTDSAIAFPLYRLAGTVLDYARLLDRGLPGLHADTLARAASAAPADRPFLEAMAGALQLVAASASTCAAQARGLAGDCPDAARRAELETLAASLDAAATRAPLSFHEAIQLAWLYALHAGTWNYGRVDVWLGPFLDRDLRSGRIDEAAALRLLQGWWRLMKAYDNQYNNRVCIGGAGRGDAAATAAADRLARLALQATRTVRLNQPQLTLRFHPGQDPELMSTALTLLGEGTTFPLLYNDDVNVPAVAAAFGVSTSDALQYQPFGCGEYILAHRSVGTPNTVINLAKCVEAALHAGHDPRSGRRTGPATPAAGELRSFEDVWNAYTDQVDHHVRACAAFQRASYDAAGGDAPFLLLSALHDDCIARARPILSGGIRHLGGTVETYGNTNAADSLHAIHEVVFQQRLTSITGLVDALDADFAGPGHARLRRALLDAPKFGNDDPAADAMSVRVHNHVCDVTRGAALPAGLDSCLVVIINNWANVIFGATTGATPDGRTAGEALANANNPAPGADRNGVTACLNSLVRLDPARHAGSVQNLKFSAGIFRRHRPALEALLDAYWSAGGSQAMLTVVSQDDLRSALAEPGKWGHLMVRVGGFSARFIDLPRGSQEEILRRTCLA